MKTAQPLFDQPNLAEAYEDLRAQDGRPNDIIETPALKSVLPCLQGCDVLDLGCGVGGMTQWAISQGAQSVRGVDVSERMVTAARSAHPAASFELGNIEGVAASLESVDVVMSGLAFHYVNDLERLIYRISGWLRPGGMMAFSVEHPVMTCSDRKWHEDASGERLHWPVDHYLTEGSRNVSWLGVEVTRYHRTVASYINAALEAGLSITRVLEPGPTAEHSAYRPKLADHGRRPSFLVIAARKPIINPHKPDR